MNKRIQQLFLHALGQTGNVTDAFYYIEEQLTGTEAKKLQLFIGWVLIKENGEPKLGRGNIEAKVAMFNDERKVTRESELTAAFNKAAKAETDEVFAKADSFERDLLKPGESIDLHRVCYPLKYCTVVSYDPTTKQVVLQLK